MDSRSQRKIRVNLNQFRQAGIDLVAEAPLRDYKVIRRMRSAFSPCLFRTRRAHRRELEADVTDRGWTSLKEAEASSGFSW